MSDNRTVVDRLAIADLVHGYAQGVDRNDGPAVAALFTDDGVLAVRSKVGEPEPDTVRRGRREIADTISAMDYRATCHVVASHTAVVDGDRATGETRCIAHHVLGPPGNDTDRVWYIRYVDTFRRTPEGWRIATRDLWLEITANGPLTTI